MDKEGCKGPIRSCTGEELKRLLGAGTAWLEKNATAINLLNVFPVPDGDTGTNMLLTMQAALEEIAHSPDHFVAAIAHGVAHGALMGARGNSGVILSQLFRGLVKGLDGEENLSAAKFAAAMKEASAVAYRGVIKPVEGTILTVAREAAEAAVAAAAERDDLLYVLERVVAAAKESVARTPSLLSVLREAGVVDAGGQGLFIILEGILRFVKGESMEVAMPAEAAVAKMSTAPSEGGMEYGYCTEFIIEGRDLNLEEIKEKIDSLGDSTMVVGDENLVRVHIHTFRPGSVIEYATGLGVLHKIKVDNIQDQHRHFLQFDREAVPPEEGGIAVVAVVTGAGLTRVFESLGISAIVPGGQTMNPSIEELLRAIDSLEAEKVIVLPNNENVIMSAQQARELSAKEVVIVPTATIPQGISAFLALDQRADLKTNAEAMERAAKGVQTAEITRAIRSTQIKGLQVEEGAVIGLLNGDLTASGDTLEEVAQEMLRQMGAERYEIITVYYGEDVSQDQAERLASEVRRRYPEQEVELIAGEQPHYHYILSAE